MAQKMTGALVFDERTDRYDIRFDLNSYYGGLHCGECFDVLWEYWREKEAEHRRFATEYVTRRGLIPQQ